MSKLRLKTDSEIGLYQLQKKFQKNKNDFKVEQIIQSISPTHKNKIS